MRPARGPALLLAAVLPALAVVVLLLDLLGTRRNGCVFDDGRAYCAMARGERAQEPFSRRLGVPALVDRLPHGWGLVDRFATVSLVAAVLVVVGVGLLTRRLVAGREGPLRRAAPVVAVALTALSPHVVPLALLAPVLVDQAAAALGLAWLLTAAGRRPAPALASPLLALAVVLVREAWALPVLAVAGLVFVTGRRLLGLLTGLAAVLGLGVAVIAPAVPGPYSSTTVALHSAKVALTHPLGTAWSLVFGAGVLGLLGLLVAAGHVARGGKDRSSIRELTAVVGVAHLLLAVVGGADISRLAAAALPFAIALAVAAAVDLPQPAGGWVLAAGTVLTVLVWQPWSVAGPGEPAYFARYYPGSTLAQLLALVAVAVAAALAAGQLLQRRSNSTPTMSSSDRKPGAGLADT